MVFAEQPGNYCFSKDFTLQHQAVPFKEGLGRFHIYIYRYERFSILALSPLERTNTKKLGQHN